MHLRTMGAALAIAALSPLTTPALAQGQPNLVDLLTTDPEFSTLVTAVLAVDEAGIVQPSLIETLSGPGPFTIFAPDNAAFAALPNGVLDGLLADPAALADILLYHVLGGQFTSVEVTAGGKQPTLLGPKVQFVSDASGVFVNTSPVLEVDDFASNGVLHTIGSVLSPDDAPNTIIDALDLQPGFQVLRAAIEAAGLTETLDGDGPFTLFAPPTYAFQALPPGTIPQLLADPNALAEILTYHVVSGEVFAADVLGLDTAQTLQGNSVFVNETPQAVFIDQAPLVFTDFQADNGVIHVVGQVLDPQPTTIVDFLAGHPSFSTLVTAVGVAGLGDALSGPDTITLFAPTNRAFAQLPDGVLDGLLADPAGLGDVLKYHVAPGALFAADVLSQTSSPTLLGPPIFFGTTGNQVFINQAQGLAFDIQLANGVIHYINGVLTPPAGR